MMKMILKFMKVFLVFLTLIFCSCASAKVEIELNKEAVEDNKVSNELELPTSDLAEDEFILSLAAKEGTLLYISLVNNTQGEIFTGPITDEAKDFKIKTSAILRLTHTENLRFWRNGEESLILQGLDGPRILNIEAPKSIK